LIGQRLAAFTAVARCAAHASLELIMSP